MEPSIYQIYRPRLKVNKYLFYKRLNIFLETRSAAMTLWQNWGCELSNTYRWLVPYKCTRLATEMKKSASILLHFCKGEISSTSLVQVHCNFSSSNKLQISEAWKVHRNKSAAISGACGRIAFHCYSRVAIVIIHKLLQFLQNLLQNAIHLPKEMYLTANWNIELL